MKTITITTDAVLEALEAAVAERGADYLYEDPAGEGDCVYHFLPEWAWNVTPSEDEDEDEVFERLAELRRNVTLADCTTGCMVGLGLHTINPELDAWTFANNYETDVSMLFGIGVDVWTWGPGRRILDPQLVREAVPETVTVEPYGLGLEIIAERAAIAALAAAQNVQDNDGTWGEALAEARRVVEALRALDTSR